MSDIHIPDIIVGRLPRYLQVLSWMVSDGVQTISSQDLGDKLGISAAQIRKDLSQFGAFGKQGTGYAIPFLIDQIQKILNVQQVWDIALVGAGDLGHAIARYQGFANRGFRILVVFDSAPEKIGQQIGDFRILDINTMVSEVKNRQIKIAMITVPAQAAQSVAEKLVDAGVRAILSYAPVPLKLPSDIQVQYFDPLIQLQHMTFYMQ